MSSRDVYEGRLKLSSLVNSQAKYETAVPVIDEFWDLMQADISKMNKNDFYFIKESYLIPQTATKTMREQVSWLENYQVTQRLYIDFKVVDDYYTLKKHVSECGVLGSDLADEIPNSFFINTDASQKPTSSSYLHQYQVSASVEESEKSVTKFLNLVYGTNYDFDQAWAKIQKNHAFHFNPNASNTIKLEDDEFNNSSPSDLVAVIDHYPILRSQYFDILLLVEAYIKVHYKQESNDEYEFQIPNQYFECSDSIV